MNFFTRLKYSFAICSVFMLCTHAGISQLVLNEIQVTNLGTISDEDGEYNDWFELSNLGGTTLSLLGYSVSDKEDAASGWSLPDIMLGADQQILLFASGKDRHSAAQTINHLETPVFPWNNWSYIIPTEEPDANWNEIGYDASSWQEGYGGFGYGDGDDGTDLGTGALSVYSRTSFNLSDKDQVAFMVLNVDYDDAFICYLNGTEIARSNIGSTGDFTGFDVPASAGHEALNYQGIPAEDFAIDLSLFGTLLQDGENVIALQVHNTDIFSSDLTGNVYVTIGMLNDVLQTTPIPEWLDYSFSKNHTDFSLSIGETLFLRNELMEIVDSCTIIPMQSDHAMKRSGTWCVTSQPTPGEVNTGNCYAAYEVAPQFNIEGGAFPVPMYVTITSPNPDALIRVTYDGSVPNDTSELYDAGISVNGSVVISARAFSDTGLPSPVKKNSYFIAETEIDLPIVSISTDPANLWDPVTGIHVFGLDDYDHGVPYFGSNFWEDWERPAYVEYYDKDHVKQMEGPVGVKIHGGWSRSNEQKSLRIQAKGKYGMDKMEVALFDDKPYIESLSGFNLRNGGNSYWEYRFHEALIERTNRTTHVDYMSYAPAIVFLNGEYWGFMEIRENLDQHFVADNNDISSSDATVVSANYLGFNVVNGDPSSFFDLHEYATTNDPNAASFFPAISAQLDIENYADYIIAETYWANGDWSNGYQNNTKLWHDDRPGGKWHFMLMDMDFGMGLAGESPTDDYINAAGGDGFLTDQLFDAVIQNDEFRTYFINRYADLMNTIYQIDNVAQMAYEMRDEVVPVFQRHAQRWGTDGNSMNSTLEYRLDWAEQRVQGSRDVVQNHFDLEAQVNIDLDVIPAGAGRIHISTIEPNDTLYPWTGVYYKGVPVRISVVENPGFTFNHWMANGIFDTDNTQREHELYFNEDLSFTAVFDGAMVANPVSITELMFHPDSQNHSGDWLEIHNNAEVAVNLGGWMVRDDDHFHTYVFPENTFIDAGEYVVIAENVDSFALAYPAVANVHGSLNFSFGNSTDEVHLFTPTGEEYAGFMYTDHDGMALDCSDGCGHSRGHGSGSSVYAASEWFLECENGSPGELYMGCDYPVTVSEISFMSYMDQDPGDWIELHNTTSDNINIGGWALRDAGDNVYELPSGLTLDPDEHLVIAKDVDDFHAVFPVTANFIGPSAITLSNDGDAIKLYDNADKLLFGMRYKTVSPWPFIAPSNGHTLEYMEAGAEPCNVTNWFDGCPLGSPAKAYDPECLPLVNIAESENNTALIYPNPATEYAYADNTLGSITEIRIYDSQSSLVLNQPCANRHRVQLDLSGLSAGVYLLQAIQANGAVAITKLVVE